MSAVDSLDDAAARAAIGARCRNALLHEIRGGLQAMSGALELLARLARSGGGEAAVIERATSIAKRSLANHETMMLDLVKQITAAEEDPEPADLAIIMEETLKVLRNDIAARRLEIRTERLLPAAEVIVPRNPLRFVLLGWLIDRIDSTPVGGFMSVRIAGAEQAAQIELTAIGQRSQDGRSGDPGPLDAHGAIIPAFVRRWVEAHGGRLEGAGPDAVRLTLPTTLERSAPEPVT
jgi:signal transduction histidine kinase